MIPWHVRALYPKALCGRIVLVCCPHRTKSSVSLRMWSGTASLPLAAATRKPDSEKGYASAR